MRAKILPFVYPAHECFYPQRLTARLVMRSLTCPRCEEHAKKKRHFKIASARRGRHQRMFVE